MTDHIVPLTAHPVMMWNRRLAAETLHFLREGASAADEGSRRRSPKGRL